MARQVTVVMGTVVYEIIYALFATFRFCVTNAHMADRQTDRHTECNA